MVEETAKGNWTRVLGIGAVGVAMSIGVVPLLIIILGLMAVGLTVMVYLLPVLLAGAVGAITFYISKESGLTGVKLVASVVIASLGSLLLFSSTSITLWSMNLVSPVTGTSAAKAQFLGWNPFSGFIKVLQMILGIVVVGFLLLALLAIRSVGPGAVSDIVVGLMASFFTGIIASSVLDFQIPGLAEGVSPHGVGILVSGIIGFAVGSVAMYSSWRWD